jgi:hypothetical protein
MPSSPRFVAVEKAERTLPSSVISPSLSLAFSKESSPKAGAKSSQASLFQFVKCTDILEQANYFLHDYRFIPRRDRHQFIQASTSYCCFAGLNSPNILITK